MAFGFIQPLRGDSLGGGLLREITLIGSILGGGGDHIDRVCPWGSGCWSFTFMVCSWWGRWGGGLKLHSDRCTRYIHLSLKQLQRYLLYAHDSFFPCVSSDSMHNLVR